eukprot:10379017-Prorocentrum_lima.AAC.1
MAHPLMGRDRQSRGTFRMVNQRGPLCPAHPPFRTVPCPDAFVNCAVTAAHQATSMLEQMQ